MTIYEIAQRLETDRPRASQMARRLEGQLRLNRITARSPSNEQRIIAYTRSDGEQILALYRKQTRKKEPKRTERETLWRQLDVIPQLLPPAPQSEVFYLIDLSGRGEVQGWMDRRS